MIISNYQGREFLPRCLRQLMNQTYDNYEVVVVDAGSTDGSPEYIEASFPEVRLILCARIGIGEAVNIGIRNATGEIICFDFNTDEFAAKDWLENSVKHLEHYNYEIISGTTRMIDGTGLIDEAGVMLDFFLRAKKIGHGKAVEKFDFKMQPVDFVGSPMFHRRLLEKVGLVDEDYFIYAEDLDFCYRARKKGIETRCTPFAVTHHCVRGTMGKQTRRAEYFVRRANIRFQLKCINSHRVFWGLSYLCFFLPFAAFIGAISGTRKAEEYHEKFWGRMGAVWWNLKNGKKTLLSRKNKGHYLMDGGI